MPDLTEYDEFNDTSKFAKAAELEKPVTLTIEEVSLDEFRPFDAAEDSGETELKVVVTFKGAKKPVIMNKTNARELAHLFGPITESWAGKQIILGTKYHPGVDNTGFTVSEVPSSDPNDDIPF